MLVPIRWALFFLFIYIGIEGFLKVISNYHPIIHVGSDLLVITMCVKVLLTIFFQGFPEGKLPPLSKIFLIHFLWVAIIMFNPYALSVISSVAGSKIYVSMFVLYFFGYYQVKNIRDVIFFMIPFISVGIIHTIFGLLQGINGPEALLALHPRYAIQLAKYGDAAFRPFGLTNLPGGPAIYMYQVFPFVLYLMFHFRSYIFRITATFYLMASGFLFFLCQVRSAILKMIVGSGLFFIGLLHMSSKTSYKAFQKILMLTSAFCLLFYFTLPKFFEYSVEQRGENEAAIERSMSLFEYDKVSRARRGAFDRFIRYAAEVPFGAGFSRVGAAAGAFKDLHQKDKIFGPYHFFTDNFWLASLVEVGIPGMLIVSFLVFLIFYRGFRNYLKCKDEEVKTLQLAVLCPLLALGLGLYGAEGLIYNPEACFFWFFSGVLMKLPAVEKYGDHEARSV